MEYLKNLLEYYDELYPVSDDQKKYYKELLGNYKNPVKILRCNCCTGFFEHQLAKEGYDVTGIEGQKDFLKTANLRRRNQLMSIRFFEMSTLDMTHFLGKNFYNVISSLENSICFIRDTTLLKKYFFDCKQLLTEDGTLVISLYNYNHFIADPQVELPVRESIRSKLTTTINNENGTYEITQKLQTGNGKIIPILEHWGMYPVKPEEIKTLALQAGFKQVTFYSDFAKTPFTGDEELVIAEIK